MGSVAGMGEDLGNNIPQKTHARTVWTCTWTVRDYMRTVHRCTRTVRRCTRTVRRCTRTVRLGSLDSVPNVAARVHVWVNH
jgi:hypothetical protein